MSKKESKVMIIGRPNVGKSTLFNRILKKKKAITDNRPGVTRDYLTYPVEWKQKSFLLLDTAGLLIDQTTDGHFQAKVEEKIKSLFSEVDLILFMVDGKSGIHAMDFEINKMLLPFKDKTMLIVNKLDSIETLSDVNDFLNLGMGYRWEYHH